MGTATFFSLMAPELTIAIMAIVLYFIDLFTKNRSRHRVSSLLALFGVILAFAFSIGQIGSPITTVWAGTYRFDSFSNAFKLLLLVGTGLVLLLSADSGRRNGTGRQVYCLILTALLGAMMLASSADMITLFVSLELLSLSIYIMIGLSGGNQLPRQVAFRSLANGTIATAIMLFGMSYIYGFSGTTNLYGISLVLDTDNHSSLLFSHRYLLTFLFMIVLFGMIFKFSSLWIPSVYDTVSLPVAAFISGVVKIAGFVLLFRFFLIAFMNAPGIHVSPTSGPVSIFVTVRPYISLIAVLAMLAGTIMASKQHNLKRLFAYISVAHAGYLLLLFTTLTSSTFSNTWFYLMVYLLANLGAFAIIQIVMDNDNVASINGLTGLFHRSPMGAIAMGIFLSSLAGVPLTAGFIGKYNILIQTWNADQAWLAVVMVIAVIISCFYYFKIIVRLFSRPAKSQSSKLLFPRGAGIIVFLAIIGTLLFGIFPDLALNFLQNYFQLNDLFKANL